MKNLLLLSGALLVTAFFAGCAENKNDVVPAPQVIACPAGSYYSNGGCYNATGYGGPSQLNFNRGFYADNYSGYTRITVVNAQKMKDLFKFGMGVCDRTGSTYGSDNCDSYLSGTFDIVIQFPPPGTSVNTMMATFIARPKVNPYANYGATLPSGWEGWLGAAIGMTTGIYVPVPPQSYYTGAYRNPLQLQMVVSAINNSAGFEARGYGDYWTGLNTTVLAIQVPNGKADDNILNFNFLVQGTVAAQGVMSRCQLPNCGL